MNRLLPRVVQAGLTYFVLVFGVGFVLGVIRVTLVVPRLGERMAELMEMPLMFVAIVVSARLIIWRFRLPASARIRLGAGCLALGLLVGAEVLLAVALQERTLGEYVASRDPVSGVVYLAMLVLFAVMPLVLARLPSASRS